jgi:heme exporter protein A
VTPLETASPQIQFQNVEKRYGGLYALRRVSLSIGAGECVALAGRNGSGKTTLLRIAAGLVRPTTGEVKFDGAGAAGSESNRPRAQLRVGFVAHATMVYDELSAEENLLLFAKLLGVAEPRRRVNALLAEVGLEERRASLVRTFSRGMRQRVALARALLYEPRVLLLDEPATGLDPQGASWLAGKLRQMRDAGCTVVMSQHGESEIASLATRGIRLDGGLIAADTRTGTTLRSILTFADA